ncbi:hypothetical protein [Terracidiphilus gabretensis]|uniref:hypothetical protein n=1 Tax=Terracidiphilus gabretensis TaxID=1577687 RepID=UPI00071B8D83|nr:hypothetical protein [Terracidiphilus gabretensis]
MVAMAHIHEVKTDRNDLKGAIEEWFHALTGAIAHGSICRPAPYNRQTVHPYAAPLTHTKDVALQLFIGWLLVAGGMAVIMLYLTQSVDWPGAGVDFLLKVANWL